MQNLPFDQRRLTYTPRLGNTGKIARPICIFATHPLSRSFTLRVRASFDLIEPDLKRVFSASKASLDVLEHILCYDGCDVDLTNRLEGATPLHLALQIQDKEDRIQVVESLLEAGASTS